MIFKNKVSMLWLYIFPLFLTNWLSLIWLRIKSQSAIKNQFILLYNEDKVVINK